MVRFARAHAAGGDIAFQGDPLRIREAGLALDAIGLPRQGSPSDGCRPGIQRELRHPRDAQLVDPKVVSADVRRP